VRFTHRTSTVLRRFNNRVSDNPLQKSVAHAIVSRFAKRRSTATHGQDARATKMRYPSGVKCTFLLLACLIAPVAFADHFDLLIRHGKVIDGAGNAWFYADVGINSGRIARIGDLHDATADKELDATNLVVAPGFIDVHTHADTDLYKLPEAEN